MQLERASARAVGSWANGCTESVLRRSRSNGAFAACTRVAQRAGGQVAWHCVGFVREEEAVDVRGAKAWLFTKGQDTAQHTTKMLLEFCCS